MLVLVLLFDLLFLVLLGSRHMQHCLEVRLSTHHKHQIPLMSVKLRQAVLKCFDILDFVVSHLNRAVWVVLVQCSLTQHF